MRQKCCSVKSVMAQVRSVGGDSRQGDGKVSKVTHTHMHTHTHTRMRARTHMHTHTHTHTHTPRKAQHFLKDDDSGFSLWRRQGGGTVGDPGVEGIQLPGQGLRHFRHHRVISVPASFVLFFAFITFLHSFSLSLFHSINQLP